MRASRTSGDGWAQPIIHKYPHDALEAPSTMGVDERMLKELGIQSVDELFSDIPPSIRTEGIALPDGLSEMEVISAVRSMLSKNITAADHPCFLGGGRLQPFHPGGGEQHHLPFRVPHLLHALSGGDQPGDAPVPVRVPELHRRAHRHGGGQLLQLRRLDRPGRGGHHVLPHQRPRRSSSSPRP